MPVRMPPSVSNIPTPSDNTVSNGGVDSAKPAANDATVSPPLNTPVGVSDWNRFADSGTPLKAEIKEFSTPNMNDAGFVGFPWDAPGDTIPFELTVDVQGDPNKVRAQLWSNANNNGEPSKYEAHEMKLVHRKGNQATFRIDLPITNVGNYRATARISTDNGQNFDWCGDKGIQDLRFRPRDERHDARDFMEVNIGNVNFDSRTKTQGTFADMMDSGTPETNGKYTLEWMASLGKTDIWLQPPFRRSKWEHRHHLDDAGSPYATKDYFSIDPEFARSAQGLTGDAASDAATKEFDEFVAKAKSLGMKVHLDIALNHVGHNYEFRDLFVRYNNAGREIREVRKNDFSQVVINPEQLDKIKERLADPNLLNYMEYVAPHMYAKPKDAGGAKSVDETISGGWGEWYDTKQLNHGARWGKVDQYTNTNQEVIDYLTRVLTYWSVDRGVDGFRLDHLTGMGPQFLEDTLNKVQAQVDQHEPGKVLHFMGEDFNNVEANIPYIDTMQGGFLWDLIEVRNASQLKGIFTNPHFQRNLINLDSHDEHRFFNNYGDDWKSATRMGTLLQLMGGPVMHLAGSEFGERQQLQFKQYKDLPSLRNIDGVQKEIAKAFKRSGNARRRLAALHDDNRSWLRPKGGEDNNIVALSRYPDPGKEGDLVFVMANMADDDRQENVFMLDEQTKQRLDPTTKYQIRDLMADDSFRPIWHPPKTGRELMESGLFCQLMPYQIQCLKLEPVD